MGRASILYHWVAGGMAFDLGADGACTNRSSLADDSLSGTEALFSWPGHLPQVDLLQTGVGGGCLLFARILLEWNDSGWRGGDQLGIVYSQLHDFVIM